MLINIRIWEIGEVDEEGCDCDPAPGCSRDSSSVVVARLGPWFSFNDVVHIRIGYQINAVAGGIHEVAQGHRA